MSLEDDHTASGSFDGNPVTPFESQPTLAGSLLRLRPLRESDREDLFRVASDPLLWAQHPDRLRHTEDGFNRFFAEAMASAGALLVIDAQSAAVIGSSRYHGYDAQQRQVEIGWTFLARSHWGGRYNAELKELMLRHAFRQVESVLFYIDPTNLRSQRSVEKIGALRDSQPDDKGRVSYRITRSRYGCAD